MTARRPWVFSPRQPSFVLLLSLVAGAATAGYAGYYLRAAWSGVSTCHALGGPGCAPHPFWGLPPELYLAACLLGIAAGAAIAIVGALAFIGRLNRRRAGYALVGLSAIGVIAYGGLGVGTVAGVLAGTLILRVRTGRAGAPSEWSGSLPTGVPPVLRAPKRSLTDRPPVTEWNGVFAAALAASPARARGRVSLPTADRLSAALEKGRTAGRLQGTAPSFPPAVVVLPPPPTGARAPGRAAASIPSTAPLRPAPSSPPAAARTPAPAAAALPRGTTGPSSGRWQPAPSDLTPWTPASGVSAVERGRASTAASGSPSPPAGLAPVGPASIKQTPEPVAAPPRPAPIPAPPPSAVAAPFPAAAPPAPASVAAVLTIPPPSAAPFVSSRARAGPLRAPLTHPSPVPPPTVFVPRAAPAPSPGPSPLPSAPAAPPAATFPAPAVAPIATAPELLAARPPPLAGPSTPPTAAPPVRAPLAPVPAPTPVPHLAPAPGYAAAPAGRPPAPGQASPQVRRRAWTCPSCNLVNAPWSQRCTRCKTEAPA